MDLNLFIAIATFVCMFILFLVIARSLNHMVNQLTKLEYILRKDFEYKKEAQEIQRIIAEQREESKEKEDARK